MSSKSGQKGDKKCTCLGFESQVHEPEVGSGHADYSKENQQLRKYFLEYVCTDH